MKWLEIIELRTIESNRELIEAQLQKLMNEVDKETKKHVIKAYSRVTIDSDFRIHLFHNSKKAGKSGSGLGICLVSALKEFGLVKHSIWIEMHSK